ncbi:polysaccharide biosynthesis/export family protein [Novosphingobium sp.]|uniref:polysaccharide biosynthesis/export family protein n=1 Tax=Novosphingobium sp. TaxID=1874826 RepID=UPI002600F353|nr:polysaccharide biosynthesis/export family protein [Novosphingobium sp.]MCC6924646.1 polysaccharide biosynthesis/export family protein [Novosphingobium sp.]
MKPAIRTLALTMGLSLALGACAGLPSSAPTASQVVGPAQADNITVIDIVPGTPSGAAARQSEPQPWTIADGAPAAGVILPGDLLTVTVFEVGYSLFGGSDGSPGETGRARGSTRTFPPIRVPESGQIDFPYAGRIGVAGLTPVAAAGRVERGLRGKSQFPQVVIAFEPGAGHSVVIDGEVDKPGRVQLSEAGERLLDVIALAGGSKARGADTVVKLTRGGNVGMARLGEIGAADPRNVVLTPGDHVELSKEVRSVTVLGAARSVSEIAFDRSELTLDQALARAGGLNDDKADPTGVFIFRIERREEAGQWVERPVIYRLNLLAPSGYFAAQRFQMRERDIMLVANAKTNNLKKFIEMVNQIASPVVTAKVVGGI